MKQYFWHIFIALDQLANAFLRGEPDETLSSRAFRLSLKGKWWRWQISRFVIDMLAWPFERDHCYKSYLSELRRHQMPKEFWV